MKYSAKTLEEVLDKAATEENIAKEELAYSVVSNTDEAVEIEVYSIVDVIEWTQNYLKEAIESLGIECKVIPSIKDDIINLKIDSDHNSVLIGKNGYTLRALNEITRLAVTNHFKHRYRILLDINGYKDDKYERIIKMARRLAHDVQKSHETVTLDPMPADERRVIHNALTNMPNIKTESTGEGKERQIQIIFVEQ